MTFNEIEKDYWETFDINQGTDKINGYPVIKISDTYSRPATVEDFESFLKQSFIKYLQSEVYRLKSKQPTPLYLHEGYRNSLREMEFNFYEDQITHLQAQIKELEV